MDTDRSVPYRTAPCRSYLDLALGGDPRRASVRKEIFHEVVVKQSRALQAHVEGVVGYME